ncbi:MAG: hypothetical protein N2653_11600, partial [Burkholderiales bacterium]|nr:hypothetical protein [Burkholderiales bacterium]
AGLFRWDAEVSATAVGVTAREGEKGTDFTFGVGLKYDFTRTVSGRLQFQRYNNVGETSTTGQSDINVWSLGLQVRF